ncbi:MAG: T9SS type A sorting domain-containing protein [Saprospiraceae bacterium]|nr:T9SS type A sorting domain-containing protein [Saprospiraceae bacterium]
MELFDDTGRLVYSETADLKDAAYFTIKNLDNLPKGVYFLRTQFGEAETQTYKLIGGN